MQVRMIELFIATSMAGLVLAGLCAPSDSSESLIYSATLLLILISVPMAIGRRGAARSYWIAFGMTASLYLFFFAPFGKDADLAGPLFPSKSLSWAYERIHVESFSDESDPPDTSDGLFGRDPDDSLFGDGYGEPDNGDSLFGDDDDDDTAPPPPSFEDLFGSEKEEEDDDNLDDLFSTVDALQASKQIVYPVAETWTTVTTLTCCGWSYGEVRDSTYYAFARIGHCAWSLMLGWLMGHVAKVVHCSATVRVK